MSLVYFENILGQNKAKNLLFRSFKQDKISHAYIFRGPGGVGKKTTALSFAAFLNCQNKRENEFCGECSSCRKFASKNHPDFLDLTPDGSTIKIEQIRELKKKLAFPPFEADFRVVLLPDIHLTMQRKEVANSLLKTLEEPPAQTLIILTADASGAVLPTILSRCQVVPFYEISETEITHKLIFDKVMDESVAKALAALASGSLGKAMRLADGVMFTLRRELLESIHSLRPNEGIAIEKIMVFASQVAELKEDIPEFLDLIRSWLRDMLFIRFGGNLALVMNHDLSHLYKNVGNRWEVADLFAKLEYLDLARKQLNHNCNRISVCEMLFWELLY